RPEDIFFDVGANVGVYSILASGVSGSKTVSIEPIQESFENLRRNINLNNLDSKIRIIHAAAGRENGIIKMTRNMDTMNHVVIPSEEETQNICEVPVIKLDDLVQDGITQIIKIDVEGFESNVIEGAKTMLSQRKICAVIMELNGAGERYGISDEYIHNLLLEYGFSTFQYFPFKRQLLSLNDRINRNGGNTLYVQNNTLDFVKERLIKASSFNVKGFEI
ncbi:MAG: FkbM family methyltransferase, partial [Anaerolineae bacterium]|nr:FkbM family methyltransferase [Anaerolineae bacterium]